MDDHVASKPGRPWWRPGILGLSGAALGAPLGYFAVRNDLALVRNWPFTADVTAGMALSLLLIFTGVALVILSYSARQLSSELYGRPGDPALPSEVREARMSGWWSLAAGVLIGLPVLAVAVPGELDERSAALVLGVVAVGLAALSWATWRYWTVFDELTRRVSWEASALSFDAVLVLSLLWGAAHVLGVEIDVPPMGVFVTAAGVWFVTTAVLTARAGLYGLSFPRR